mmetsp:Transcript_67998/g.164376  ORF Transcript_67998/g.164376 Transcript_67998/m.164376 type:complete len:216 (+) Transcript_67998:1294-1941(+)
MLEEEALSTVPTVRVLVRVVGADGVRGCHAPGLSLHKAAERAPLAVRRRLPVLGAGIEVARRRRACALVLDAGIEATRNRRRSGRTCALVLGCPAAPASRPAAGPSRAAPLRRPGTAGRAAAAAGTSAWRATSFTFTTWTERAVAKVGVPLHSLLELLVFAHCHHVLRFIVRYACVQVLSGALPVGTYAPDVGMMGKANLTVSAAACEADHAALP